jgi:cell wall-associated NlpC family hydrolase
VKQFYSQTFSISFADYAYPEVWWDTNPELNLYLKNYDKEGFQLVDADSARHLQFGDVFLMACASRVANHAGIWLGNGDFLHHPYQALSTTARWAGGWMTRTVGVLRHPDVAALIPQEVIGVETLIPKGKRDRYRELLAKHTSSQLPTWTQREGGTGPQEW